jgi:hypothetical protein
MQCVAQYVFGPAASSHRASCAVGGGLKVAQVHVVFRPRVAGSRVLYGALQITETKRAALTLWWKCQHFSAADEQYIQPPSVGRMWWRAASYKLRDELAMADQIFK